MNSSIAAVIDTSAVMAIFLSEDEAEAIEGKIQEILSVNGQLFVPPLFWYETGNTLVTAIKRGRITADDLRGIEADLAELPIITEPMPAVETRMRIREISLEKSLSFYDAAYLELSNRLDFPLISLDKKLITAAARRFN
ncbi:MAG TPA: VapC toxin family PIN domain ribonuclease [Spirochaeta sp.]|nr:VapC toxin family PIN domain ribonuclease [Spirochaeta sp.]